MPLFHVDIKALTKLMTTTNMPARATNYGILNANWIKSSARRKVVGPNLCVCILTCCSDCYCYYSYYYYNYLTASHLHWNAATATKMFATTAAVSPLCTNTNMCCTKRSYCYYFFCQLHKTGAPPGLVRTPRNAPLCQGGTACSKKGVVPVWDDAKTPTQVECGTPIDTLRMQAGVAAKAVGEWWHVAVQLQVVPSESGKGAAVVWP